MDFGQTLVLVYTASVVLRELTARALGEFPANPEFLAVFLAGEVRTRIAGRVRAHFGSALRRQGASVVEWVIAIAWEALSRRPAAVHRVRTPRVFEIRRYRTGTAVCLYLAFRHLS